MFPYFKRGVFLSFKRTLFLCLCAMQLMVFASPAGAQSACWSYHAVHYWDGITWLPTKLEALQWSLTRKLSGYSSVTGNLPPTNPTYGEYQTKPCVMIVGPEVGYGGRGQCQTFFPPTNAFVDYEDGWVTAECEPTIEITPLKSTTTQVAPVGELLPFKAKVSRQ